MPEPQRGIVCISMYVVVKKILKKFSFLKELLCRVRSDEELTLETSASLSLHGENLTLVNFFDIVVR